jgi:hypothetical protein
MLSSSEIPKLEANGSNWVAYQYRMEEMMNVLGLKDHLTNATMPESYSKAEAVDGISPADRWRRDDAAAKLYIKASLPELSIKRTIEKSSAKEAWDRLQETFGHKHRIGLAVARLERRLFNKRCGDNEDVRSHFEKLCDLRSQLVCLGKNLSDNEFSYILLTSFPASYDACIAPLNITVKIIQNDLDPFVVMSAITDFYDLRMLRNSESRATQQRSPSSSTRRKTRKGH